MAYLIKAFTFASPVPAPQGFPLYGESGVSFADAKEEHIYLDDVTNSFDAISHPVDQHILREIVIGGKTLNVGTTLTYKGGTVAKIISTDTRDEYLAVMPRAIGSGIHYTSTLGDGTTVLIMPAYDTTPDFDPAKEYKFSSTYTRNSIPMKAAEIPKGYLGTVCFAAGTMIMTVSGPRPVEDLSVGELVMTRDRGPRPLCWIGHRHVSARVLDLAPNLRPVTIRKGALGNRLPRHDLTVSPQHRVLIDSPVAKRICGAAEGLVAAKHLCDMPGVSIGDPPEGVEYYHLLFDRHELVQSNGCWTESMFTGPEALKSLGPSARREIRALFPQLFADQSTPRNGVRRFLTGKEAKELTRRHLKNDKALLA